MLFGFLGLLVGGVSGFQVSPRRSPFAEDGNDDADREPELRPSIDRHRPQSIDESVRREFEAAWNAGTPREIESLLPDPQHPRRRATLVELVLIDLECRWKQWAKHCSAGNRYQEPELSPYYQRFPELKKATTRLYLAQEAKQLREQHFQQAAASPQTPAIALVENPGNGPADCCTTGDLAETVLSPQPGQPPVVAVPGLAQNRLGRFQIQECLGQGAFGAVFRAYDPRLDREVAIKVPRLALQPGSEELQRFLREARAAAQLRHPNIVQVYETGEEASGHFIVSEFVAGKSLRQILQVRVRFPCREAAVLVAKLAAALDYAHRHGVVHRDMKPDNVLIDQDGEPRITDFGLARRTSDEEIVTVDGTVMGTPAYMSPEQAQGQSSQADARSDLWSLGVVLYELLAGTRPFQGGSTHQVLAGIVRREPVSLRDRDRAIPSDLETIVARCLVKDPEKRYPSCQLLAEELGRWMRGEPIQARRVTRLERFASWCRREPALATGTISAVLAASVALTIGLRFGYYYKWSAGELDRRSKSVSEAQNKSTEISQQNLESKRTLAATRYKQGLDEASAGRVERGMMLLADARDLAGEINELATSEDSRRGIETFANAALRLRNAYQLPKGDVQDLAVVSTEGLALLGAAKGEPSIWQLATGKPLESLGQVPAHPSRWISADGSVVVKQQGNELSFWETATGRVRGSLQLPVDKYSFPLNQSDVVVNHFGSRVAVFRGNSLTLFDTASGLPLGTLSQQHRHSMVFLPGRDAIVVWDWPGSKNGTIRIWNIVTGKYQGTPVKLAGSILWVVPAPDGQHLLIGQWDKSKATELWRLPGDAGDLSTELMKLLANVTGQQNARNDSEPIKVATLESKESALRGGINRDGSLAFTTNSTLAVAGSRDNVWVQIWSLPAGNAVGPRVSFAKGLRGVGFAGDGRTLVTVDGANVVRCWDIAGIDAKPTVPRKEWENVVAFDMSPDGRYMATTKMDSLNPVAREAKVQLWSAFTGQALGPPVRVKHYEDKLMFNPRGAQLLISTEADCTLWEATDRGLKLPRRLPISNTPAYSRRNLFTSAGSKLITFGRLSANNRAVVHRWDTAATPLEDRLGPESSLTIEDSDLLRVTSDGRLLLSVVPRGVPRQVQFWDLDRGKLLGSGKSDKPIVHCEISPDGKRAAIGTAKALKIWDAERVEELEVGIPADRMRQVVWSPSGRLLAMTGDRFRLYDVEARKFFSLGNRLQGVWVYAVLFSQDEKKVYLNPSNSANAAGGTCGVLDLAANSDAVFTTIDGRQAIFDRMGVSTDYRLLATSHDHTGLQFWHLPSVQRIGQQIPFKREPRGGTSRRDLVRMAFAQGNRTVVQVDQLGSVSLWDVPRPVIVKTPHTRDWVAAYTGLRVNSKSELEALDLATWTEKRTPLASVLLEE